MDPFTMFAVGTGVNALSNIFGASSAAKAQKEAAMASLALQRKMWDKTQQNLAPFIQGGGNALGVLGGLTGTGPGGNPLTAPLTRMFQPTPEMLAQTPGYQFLLDQGMKSVQNNFAAKGLGSSGAAIKGALDYTKGLADTTWGERMREDLAQRQGTFNMLFPQASLGAGAAGGAGQIGAQTAGTMAGTTEGMGNAQAAADISMGRAVGGAAQAIPNAYWQYNLLQQMMPNMNNSIGNAYGGAYGSMTGDLASGFGGGTATSLPAGWGF